MFTDSALSFGNSLTIMSASYENKHTHLLSAYEVSETVLNIVHTQVKEL
jgi:hypothetical protein